MSEQRQGNGRFGPGNRANPGGRPRKDRSVNATILKELNAPVVITENKRRRRISKLAANAKQVANQGASGNVRAAKIAIDLAMKAEREAESIAVAPPLSISDREIVDRMFARLGLIREVCDEAAGD